MTNNDTENQQHSDILTMGGNQDSIPGTGPSGENFGNTSDSHTVIGTSIGGSAAIAGVGAAEEGTSDPVIAEVRALLAKAHKLVSEGIQYAGREISIFKTKIEEGEMWLTKHENKGK